jgi:hypothetical protein
MPPKRDTKKNKLPEIPWAEDGNRLMWLLSRYCEWFGVWDKGSFPGPQLGYAIPFVNCKPHSIVSQIMAIPTNEYLGYYRWTDWPEPGLSEDENYRSSLKDGPQPSRDTT